MGVNDQHGGKNSKSIGGEYSIKDKIRPCLGDSYWKNAVSSLITIAHVTDEDKINKEMDKLTLPNE
jgi:hypothetical protein